LRSEKNGVKLNAELINSDESIVEFSWSAEKTWSEILQLFGDVPLPPYIKRSTNNSDKERYQTIYSSTPGAVAAPTAGLHFTPEILERLRSKGIAEEFLTLHVSAGTFQPIKNDVATQHHMHEERIYFTKQNIENLSSQVGKIIPVGTTSCRSLESLYWYGVQLISLGSKKLVEFNIDQNFPYRFTSLPPSRQQALSAILDKMNELKITELSGSTSIFIHPGYTFRMTDGLITNFHQPGSTLLLLIAALIGDNWKNLYDSALKEGYRFLSYGDSSLLFPSK
jgi:S-adenosylmethionine:tRNA ribosyltransferase-isomerase